MFRLCVCLLIFCSACNLKMIDSNKSKVNQDPFIIMERTACYGTCPQYEISIYRNGLIQYNGTAFVDRLSCFQSFLHASIIIDIQLYLESINFFQLDTAYLSPLTDLPSVITEVKLNNKTHKVVDRLNGPIELKYIYSLIDSAYVSVIEWKKCENSY